MRKLTFIFCCFAFIVSATVKLRAQNYLYATGNPSFSTQIPIENGFINVNNGEIHLEIPLAANTQRGKLQLAEKLVYDSRIWKIINNSGYNWQPTNVPNSMGGWVFSSGLGADTLSYWVDGGQTWCNPGNLIYGYYRTTQNDHWVWMDPQGSSHIFYASTYQYTAETTPSCPSMPSNVSSASGYAADGSGYYIKVSNYTSAVIYDKDGTAYYPTTVQGNPTPNSVLIADANGNYFSADSNGNLVDSLNRTPVLVSTSGNHIYYDVLTYGGARSLYTVTTETVNYHTAFGQSGVTDESGSFTAIQSIQLPDGSSYSFGYDSGTAAGNYGELTSVTLPTGGVIQYGYMNFLDSFQNQNRWVHTRLKDGGTTTLTPATISNCSSSAGCQEKTTVAGPTGNDTVYTFALDKSGLDNASSWITNIDAYQGSATGGTKLKSVSTSFSYATSYYNKSVEQSLNGGQTNQPSSVQVPYQYPSSETTISTLSDIGLSTKTETDFVALGSSPSAVKQWDYYSGTAPSAPTEETDYTYGYSVNGAVLPTQVSVKDGSGNPISQTTYGYDETTGSGHAGLVTTSGLSNHSSVSGNRGNLTTASQWINTSGSTLGTMATYDDAGSLLTSTSPNGTTTYGHDSTDTFVISTTPPTPSSGVSLRTSATYDSSTGLVTSTTDPNGTQTVYKNYDVFGRVGEIDNLDSGGATVGKTQFPYLSNVDSGVSSYQNASTSGSVRTLIDAYGRQSRVAVLNGQSSNPWYQNDTCYDSNGNASFQSNSYQGTGWSAAKVCSGSGDASTYDALGRVKMLTHADGSNIQYSYTGRATKVTDENGVSRITQVDGLGRTTNVCEISSNSSMPGSGSPGSCGTDISGTGFTATYAYDMANHKTTTTQGAQQRVFQTDWLGRTILTQEPERGQTTYSYSYNSTGLIVTRQRPKANQTNPSVLTTTTMQYDTLGRMVNKSFNDGSGPILYGYDTPSVTFSPTSGNQALTVVASLQHPAGRLAWTCHEPAAQNACITQDAYSYDAMGRVIERWSATPSYVTGASSVHTQSYSYDWSGNFLSSGDAGGVTTFYNNYSTANEVGSITSSLSDATHPGTLVSNVMYGPFGPTSYQLGNGLTTVLTYDSMGRRTGGWVCRGSSVAGCTGGTQLYGFTASWKGVRVLSSCDSSLNRCETYNYDEFNRLASQTTTSGTAVNLSWVYDRYGNRWQENPNGAGFAVNAANNQISTAGYTYDAAGNLLSDGISSYTYDAEGNLIQTLNGVTNKYTYDALNHEVRYDYISGTTIAPSEYVPNLSGQISSAWDVNSGLQAFGTTYWGGMPVEAYLANFGTNKAFFPHFNWVASKRLTTDNTGAVFGVNSALPYGDAFMNVSGSRAGTFDDFGGMWDGSSSMHAQFRDYNPPQGRWHSPDPYDGSYDFSNPQSLNRYSYVLNNPLSFTDPTGQGPEGAAGCLGGPVGCVVGVAVAAIFDDWLFNSIFGGPSFHGSLKPRPNAQPWDEYNIHYGPNIAGALGLPDAGCDFGACRGGIDYFQQGNAPSVSKAWSLAKAFGQVAWYSFLASQNIHAPYADPSDPNHRLFGTHYCGPGGGGSITSPTDNACYLHDKCYSDNGFSPIDNFNPFLSVPQGHTLQGCNQALCDATAQISSGAATTIGGYFTGTGIYHCSTY